VLDDPFQSGPSNKRTPDLCPQKKVKASSPLSHTFPVLPQTYVQSRSNFCNSKAERIRPKSPPSQRTVSSLLLLSTYLFRFIHLFRYPGRVRFVPGFFPSSYSTGFGLLLSVPWTLVIHTGSQKGVPGSSCPILYRLVFPLSNMSGTSVDITSNRGISGVPVDQPPVFSLQLPAPSKASPYNGKTPACSVFPKYPFSSTPLLRRAELLFFGRSLTQGMTLKAFCRTSFSSFFLVDLRNKRIIRLRWTPTCFESFIPHVLFHQCFPPV